jgi:tetratricopeptide (TPR) repeat protein
MENNATHDEKEILLDLCKSLSNPNAYFQATQAYTLANPDKPSWEPFEYFEQAMELFRRVGDIKKERECCENLAKLLYQLDRFEEAVHWLKRSIEISRCLGDVHMEIISRVNLGNNLLNSGNTNEAVNVLEIASDDAQKSRRYDLAAIAIAHLGTIYQDNGNYQEAIHKFTKAIQFAKRDEKWMELPAKYYLFYKTYLNLGLSHENVGDPTTAIEYYEKGLRNC